MMREAINIIYHSVLGSICSYQIKNEAAGSESSVHWSRHEFIYACNQPSMDNTAVNNKTSKIFLYP